MDDNNLYSFYLSHGKQDDYEINIAAPVKTVGVICIASGAQQPRRLTPVEEERLMGWNDNHTAMGINGQIPDSKRYKMCGNGVVAPVATYLATLITPILRGN